MDFTSIAPIFLHAHTYEHTSFQYGGLVRNSFERLPLEISAVQSQSAMSKVGGVQSESVAVYFRVRTRPLGEVQRE